MIQGAFWSGEIQKQDDTIEDFFQQGEGSLYNHIRVNLRLAMRATITAIPKVDEVKEVFDLNLPVALSKENYHDNFYYVRGELEKLFEAEEGKWQDGIVALISLMNRSQPPVSRTRRQRKIRGNENPERLSVGNRIKFADINLRAFMRELGQRRNTPSGFSVYGQDTLKYLTALFKVKMVLETIADDTLPDSKGEKPEAESRTKGEIYIRGLSEDIQSIATTIRENLQSKVDILLPELDENNQFQQKTTTVWDAITEVGYIYGLIGISDPDEKDRILSGMQNLDTLATTDREKSQQFHLKLGISTRQARRLVTLGKQFVDNREQWAETRDKNEDVTDLEHKYDQIKEEYIRVAGSGQSGDNQQNVGEEEWDKLLSKNTELEGIGETAEQRQIRIDMMRRLREGEVVTEKTPESKPFDYKEGEEELWENDDN